MTKNTKKAIIALVYGLGGIAILIAIFTDLYPLGVGIVITAFLGILGTVLSIAWSNDKKD